MASIQNFPKNNPEAAPSVYLSSVREGRDQVEDQLDRLYNNVQDLFEVLGLVLLDENDEDPTFRETTPETSPSRSQLGRDFANIRERLNALNDQLITLRRRIDL